MVSTPFIGRLAREIIAGRPMKFWEEHLRSSLLEPFHGQGAKSLRMAGLREADLLRGELPIPICTCIADGAPPNKYDWVSFSPFGAVRYGAAGATRDWSSLHPYSLAELMAVFGSAFAFDWESAPESLRRFAPAKYNEPLLSAVSGKDTGVTNDRNLGRLRDAGIASNVPVPVLMKSVTGRDVNVVLVMDASELEAGEPECTQLWRLRENLPWLNEADVLRPFRSGEMVRVFVPPTADDPVIVYTLGYTAKATFDTNYSREEVVAVQKYMSRVAAAMREALLRVLPSILGGGNRSTNSVPHAAECIPVFENAVVTGGDAVALNDDHIANRVSRVMRQYFVTMGMLPVPGTQQRMPFNSTYSKVTVVTESMTGGNRAAGPKTGLLSLQWPAHKPAERNFWLVVGTAGVGKSTLSMQLARDQGSLVGTEGWPFAAILRVSCHVLVTIAARADGDLLDSVVAAALHDPTADVGAPPSGELAALAAELKTVVATQRCLLVFDGFDEAQFDSRMHRVAKRVFTTKVSHGDDWARDVLLTTRPQHDPLFFSAVSKRLALNPWDTTELRCFVDNYARYCRLMDPERAMSLLSRNELATLSSTPLMAELLCHMVSESLDASSVSARAALAYCIGCLMERRPAESKQALSSSTLLDRLQQASVQWHRSLGRWDWVLDPTTEQDRAILSSGFVCVIGRELGEFGERLRTALVHQTLAEYLTSRHICTGGTAYIDEGVTLGKLDEVVLACLADPAFTVVSEQPSLNELERSTSLTFSSSSSMRRAVPTAEIRQRLIKRFCRLIADATSEKGPNADFIADLEKHGSTSYPTRAKWRERLKINRIMSFLAAVDDADAAKAIIDAYLPTFLGGLINKRKCLAPVLSEAAAAAGAVRVLNVLRSKKLLDAQRAVLEAESNRQDAALRNLLQDRVAPSLAMAESVGNDSLVGSFIDGMRHPITGSLTEDGEREVLDVAMRAAVQGRTTQLTHMLKHCSRSTCIQLLAALGPESEAWRHVEQVPQVADWIRQSPWVRPTLLALQSKRDDLSIMQCDDVAALAGLVSRMKSLRFLEIVGVNMDHRDATALARALPELPQLQSVSIVASGLDDAGAVELATGLGKAHGLTELDVSDNLINLEGAVAMAGAIAILAKQRRLRVVSAQGNPFGDGGLPDFVAAAVQCPALEVLDVRSCGAHMGSSASVGISLASPPAGLRRVAMSYNCFGSQAHLLTHRLGAHANLRELDLEACGLTAQAIAALSQCFGGLRSLAVLNLSRNPMGSPGLEALASQLRHLRSLVALLLVDAGLTGGQEVANLGQVLDQAHGLEVLDLSDNDIGDTAMSHLLHNICRSGKCPIAKLGLRCVGLGIQAAGALGNALVVSSRLSWLDVSLNPLGDGGCAVLCPGLRCAQALVALDMSGCGLTYHAAARLRRALDASSRLSLLKLVANDLTDAGKGALEGSTVISRALSL
jgi:Ran GTPase-activating protein (RanGAP) involved in mRNA processing and transport